MYTKLPTHRWAHTWPKVVPKKLWIAEVVLALTVAAGLVVHALKVADSRINGSSTNKEPVVPCNQYTCSWSFAFWGQVSDLPTNRLAPTTIKRKSMTAKSKKWLFTILLTLPLLSQGQTIFGAPDCGQWVKDNNPNRKAWLLGYMSGLNVAHELADLKPKDPLDKMRSAEQAFLWIDNYCKANPLKTVAIAGLELFQELKSK